MWIKILLGLLAIFAILSPSLSERKAVDLLLLTVASDETDGFSRYLRSTTVNGLKGKVLGLGKPWKGGDMNYPGGAYKVNLLKEEVLKYKERKDLLLLFSDSYDVLLLKDKTSIIRDFLEFKADVVFGAEGFCWPDANLAEKYPKSKGYRFLNSGAFIGYADVIYEILTHEDVDDKADDQRYYTNIYLNEKTRNKLNIKLDHSAKLFQNLNGAVADVELRFGEDGHAYLYNVVHDNQPALVHGNGGSKVVLNGLGNYLPKAWNKIDHSTACLENRVTLSTDLPVIFMGVFIDRPSPFLTEFLSKIAGLNYSKYKIDFFIYVGHKYHDEEVKAFLKKYEKEYRSMEHIDSNDETQLWRAKNKALESCMKGDCSYFFNVDSDSHLDNADVLKVLLEQNRPIIAPMILRPYKAWSNFWGALSQDGFYARSSDYMEIAQYDRKGVWNVPFVASVFLINGDVLKKHKGKISFANKLMDADMAFCSNVRDAGVFMFLTNLGEYGHLVNINEFDHTNTIKHNEIWEIMNNPYDWELRYVHPDYVNNFDDENPAYTMPCPDVYDFAMFTKRFAQEFVDVAEAYGKWSDGSSSDKRLDSGYEAVPTRDIHMNQINYEKEWLFFLKTYVMPLQQKVFIGYFNDPPRALMSFIVRYRPDEQPSLRPHHDSSTYTINIALNEDFEGGGCKFIRYNCSIVHKKAGVMSMHPGRLTHYHEGLETTKGTRYIMVTFIDP